MRKFVLIASAALLLAVAYAAAGPYITIAEIKKGVAEQDSELLAEKIDFSMVRQDLKEQLRAKGISTAVSEAQNNPVAALVAGLATTIVDGVVDSFVTPAGLASLMGGKKPSNQTPRRSDTSGPRKKEGLFRNARYGYDSLSKFSAWVPTDDGKEIRFILQRDGLSWRLVKVVLPIGE
jgi:Protein of unknown function (DUF2939)